ncbi:hypothetical protein, partial [Escherichia coli]|uniref:hypothetical protein n=1 Tax=Escherichia coli TaxID=562 RepID=UPI0021CFD726
MLDKIKNKGTQYNHLKLDTFEAAISTAQDIIDIIKYIKENKLKCVKTPERTMYKDDDLHVSVVKPKDKDGNR